MERSSDRYGPRPDRNAALREELLKLARQKPRYGYRRLHVLLERRGYEVNVKRVYRLYLEEGLSVRRKKRKRLVRDRVAEARLTGPNQEWAMDFIVDGLATGRMVRILSVVDAYTRECVALEADFSLGSGRVTRVLERAIAERGRPENLRSDNGPEFTSRRMVGWAEDWKVGLVHIQPGRPMQNGHVESFHGRLRDECLNTSWFRTLHDVRDTLANWRREYNWVSYCPTSLCSCEQALVLFGMKYRGSALPRPYPLFQCLCCFYFQSIPADHPGTICKRMIGRDLATVDCQP